MPLLWAQIWCPLPIPHNFGLSFTTASPPRNNFCSLGKEKSFKFRGVREDLPGVEDFITSNNLSAASSCTWCPWRRATADTEEGSLNPDLKIREKGVPGNRLYLKGSQMKGRPTHLETQKWHYRSERVIYSWETPMENMQGFWELRKSIPNNYQTLLASGSKNTGGVGVRGRIFIVYFIFTRE